MSQIICPSCKGENSPDVNGFLDGTYTETCQHCFDKFSYKVLKGVAFPWKPSNNVTQNYKGKGNAGGKD